MTLETNSANTLLGSRDYNSSRQVHSSRRDESLSLLSGKSQGDLTTSASSGVGRSSIFKEATSSLKRADITESMPLRAVGSEADLEAASVYNETVEEEGENPSNSSKGISRYLKVGAGLAALGLLAGGGIAASLRNRSSQIQVSSFPVGLSNSTPIDPSNNHTMPFASSQKPIKFNPDVAIEQLSASNCSVSECEQELKEMGFASDKIPSMLEDIEAARLLNPTETPRQQGATTTNNAATTESTTQPTTQYPIVAQIPLSVKHTPRHADPIIDTFLLPKIYRATELDRRYELYDPQKSYTGKLDTLLKYAAELIQKNYCVHWIWESCSKSAQNIRSNFKTPNFHQIAQMNHAAKVFNGTHFSWLQGNETTPHNHTLIISTSDMHDEYRDSTAFTVFGANAEAERLKATGLSDNEVFQEVDRMHSAGELHTIIIFNARSHHLQSSAFHNSTCEVQGIGAHESLHTYGFAHPYSGTISDPYSREVVANVAGRELPPQILYDPRETIFARGLHPCITTLGRQDIRVLHALAEDMSGGPLALTQKEQDILNEPEMCIDNPLDQETINRNTALHELRDSPGKNYYPTVDHAVRTCGEEVNPHNLTAQRHEVEKIKSARPPHA